MSSDQLHDGGGQTGEVQDLCDEAATHRSGGREGYPAREVMGDGPHRGAPSVRRDSDPTARRPSGDTRNPAAMNKGAARISFQQAHECRVCHRNELLPTSGKPSVCGPRSASGPSSCSCRTTSAAAARCSQPARQLRHLFHVRSAGEGQASAPVTPAPAPRRAARPCEPQSSLMKRVAPAFG